MGHGCEGSPNTTVRVRIPDGVTATKPMPEAGLTLETRVEAFAEPVPYCHQMLTAGVREIVWSGGSLPDEWYDRFVFWARLPDAGQPGDVLRFPVVQEYKEGVHRWIEIPHEGQGADGLEEPAPAVTLTAPLEGH